MKFKHRVMVEVTFDKKVSTSIARRAVQEVMDDADKEKILGFFPADIRKVVTKEGERVARAEWDRGFRAGVMSENDFDKFMGPTS